MSQDQELLTFISNTERSFFRTHHDTGANLNALMVWNLLREHAGLPELRRSDLIRRYLAMECEDALRTPEPSTHDRLYEFGAAAMHRIVATELSDELDEELAADARYAAIRHGGATS